MNHMDISKARGFIDTAWSDSILPQLVEYVRIPNKSPIFDREWDAHGHMEQAVQRNVSGADRTSSIAAAVLSSVLPVITM